MLSDEEKALSETEIRFRADLLILNSEFPTHRKTEAMEELLEIYKKQSKEIEELKQEKEYLNCIIESDKDNYINKDKIKAKIEELKAIADNGANAVRFAMTHEDEIERIQKQKDIGTMVEVLQSLLEKE